MIVYALNQSVPGNVQCVPQACLRCLQVFSTLLNCNSSYVIYLGTCKKCRGQYVGKTKNAFKKRHSGHKQEVKNIIGGLGHHYGGQNGCGYGNISIQIIDQVEQGDLDALAERETYWQNQLRCYVEHGGNAHCYRKEI